MAGAAGSARRARNDGSLLTTARQSLERFSRDAIIDPRGVGLCAQRLVEIPGGAVPVEDSPFESSAVAFEGKPRQVNQQRLPDRSAAKRGPHEQILQVQAVFADKGRKIVEIQWESGGLPPAVRG